MTSSRDKYRESGDLIFTGDGFDPWMLPHVRASDPAYVKHVYCEGSRDHVQSYGAAVDILGNTVAVTRCSHRNCIINKHAAAIIATLRDYDASSERSRVSRLSDEEFREELMESLRKSISDAFSNARAALSPTPNAGGHE